MIYFLMPLMISVHVVSTGDISHASHSLYCDLGLISDSSCPIDGGWTLWSKWSSCTGKCGSKGTKMRNRNCNNPLPSDNGAPCIGPSYQIEACQIEACTIKDYEEMVHHRPIQKKEMKIIQMIHERVPALAELCFSVECSFPMVKKILGGDTTNYWNAMNCVKYDVGCPIHGDWSNWETWSSCSAICGRGQKYRVRQCNSPPPSDLTLTCEGSSFEARNCTGLNCKQHLKGTWNSWSKWSTCSVHCGKGIQTRKRSCKEVQSEQGISCEGSAKEIKSCKITNCSVDGGWSPWTSWTTCSSNCGIGMQLRNRVCNNPSPSGNGASCSGLASEAHQCFTKPCSVLSHETAYFTGESILYISNNTPSHLLHVYLRFLPLGPFGVLLHRFQDNCQGSICDFIRIFLQNGKIVLLSQISGCTLSLIYEDKLEIGQWHVILALIWETHATLRIDNGSLKTTSFPCIPVMQNLGNTMKIGEGFRGYVQEIIINFASINLRLPKSTSKDRWIPYSTNYVMGDDEEGFINVALTESVIAPCPKKMEFWQITIAARPESINGIITIIPGDSLNKYILLTLDEGRVKLKFRQGSMYATAESKDYISAGEWFEITMIQNGQNLYVQVNGNEKNYIPSISEKHTTTCAENIYLGAIRDEIKKETCPKCADIPQMSFTLGYLNIDGNQLDLLTLPILETTNNRFASRSISLADHYTEVPLLLGEELKLSCFYDRTPHKGSIKSASSKGTRITWLLLDTPINFNEKSDDKVSFTLKDDGHVSTIIAASYISHDAIENFYSCHIRRYKNKSLQISDQSLFTFGVTVIDENKGYRDLFWKEWSFIFHVITACFIVVIIWLLVEGLWEIKNGSGFYKLPRTVHEGDPTSIVNFVLSTNGITLLGSQKAADEVVTKIMEDNQMAQVN